MVQVKKFFLVGLSFFVIFGSAISPISAKQSNEHEQALEINYETDLGHENRTKDEIIQELMGEGYSLDDSNFYAKMDILAAQLENNGIVLEDTANEYSDLYIKANKEEIRKKALELDPSAIKALFKSSQSMSLGNEDIEKAQQLIKPFNDEMKYNIKYPDGSSATFYIKTSSNEYQQEGIKTNTNLSGPWNQSEGFTGENFEANPSSEYTTTTWWSYNAGISTAKVEDVLKWGHRDKSSVIDFVSDTGSSFYAGVVKIDTEYLSNSQTGYNSEREYVLQGYTDVVFTVSASFSASFGKYLGISVDAGAGWHQYCIAEILLFSPSKNAIGTYGSAGQFI
ncbi:hypothetical protein ABEX25_11895 [Paenibacillus thiaminolyticus]|uniref:hypothetical protein n=1 Tax=Paenibacillus thiaminolyticus TaxID=49283 RepID=UPI003D2D8F24